MRHARRNPHAAVICGMTHVFSACVSASVSFCKMKMVSMNGKSSEEIRATMPQTVALIDALRASMEQHVPGSSKGLNRSMAMGVRGQPRCFHFVETGPDGVEREIGAAA